MSESRCPLCAGIKFQPLRLGLVECVQCGLTVSPAIWQLQANENFEDEWFGENYQPQTSFWVRLFEASNNRRTLRRIEKTRFYGRHLLEVGVGSGSFLQDAFRLLKPGGVVHIAVPNVACWEAILPGWTSYEPYHLSYFTRSTLQKTVLISRFSIGYEITHESFSGWFLAILRTILGVNRGVSTIQPNARA